MKSVVKFAPAEGVYPSAAITPVCVFGTLAACAGRRRTSGIERGCRRSRRRPKRNPIRLRTRHRTARGYRTVPRHRLRRISCPTDIPHQHLSRRRHTRRSRSPTRRSNRRPRRHCARRHRSKRPRLRSRPTNHRPIDRSTRNGRRTRSSAASRRRIPASILPQIPRRPHRRPRIRHRSHRMARSASLQTPAAPKGSASPS